MLDIVRNGFRWLTPSADKQVRREYAKRYQSSAIDPQLVFYETRDGKSIVDSPLAIFIYLANSDKYKALRHVWSVDENEDLERITMSIPAPLRSRVSFVVRGSQEYIRTLLTAHYLINDSTFESYFTKRSGQIYINTWHGTPLKKMGFDTKFNVDSSKNVLRNLLMTDFLLSPNSHTSNVFLKGYKLEGLYAGQVLEGGYPRIDFTVQGADEVVEASLKDSQIHLDPNKPTLLYTPTWKGTNVNQATDDIEQIIAETRALIQRFSGEYNVLLKVHPFAFDAIRNDDRVKGHLISNYLDANMLLASVDLLITDYSSIFFDYLVTGKPIIFYSWDSDLYNAERGMYFQQSSLPGPVAENLPQLLEIVANISLLLAEHEKQYREFRNSIVPYDDGHTTERYVEYIFSHVEQDRMNVIRSDNRKTKLLFYPGGMRNNGITSSFMNLMNNIDFERFDVTVLCNVPSNVQSRRNIEALNPHVRPMFRFGNSILTAREEFTDLRLMNDGLPANHRNRFPLDGYRRESRRLTGTTNFDVAIDFSGYSYFWARHILGANASKYIAFMHNDLDADAKREVDGAYPMAKGLRGIFSLYFMFDRLLSVSPMTRDVNAKKLSRFVQKEQMGSVTNTINIESILATKPQAQDNQAELEIKRENLQVAETTTKSAFVSLSDIADQHQFSVTLTPESQIVGFATIDIQRRKFTKVSVDAKYVGWIDKSGLEAGRLHLSSVTEASEIATVGRWFSSKVYAELTQDHPSALVTGRAQYLKGHYVTVDKFGETEDGSYAHLKYRGQSVGWVSRKSLVREHQLSQVSPLRLYFWGRELQIARNEVVKLPQRVDDTTGFFRTASTIRDDKILNLPAETTGSKVLTKVSDYKTLVFLVDEIVVNTLGESYARLTERGDVLGYTRIENLESISADEYYQSINNKALVKADNLPETDISGKILPKFSADFYNVVNMGRLSPEKNQSNLIEGFSTFVETHPNSRLYILGDGPLAEQLVATIENFGMDQHVFMLGHVDQPYNFLAKCDLFILPSLYEGQPMVLLEALTLGMRILVSDIPANIQVAGRNQEYGQFIHGTSAEAIANGLQQSKQGAYSPRKFNYQDYNKQAMAQFYREIEANSRSNHGH